MRISGVTWTGPEIRDREILERVPSELVAILEVQNGFILHRGALHVRGAAKTPSWHSLREAIEGSNACTTLYSNVSPNDVPFAQDAFGDQFLLRDGRVLRLAAETGALDEMAASLQSFFERVEADAEAYLNISLGMRLEPGQLLFAFPPFFVDRTPAGREMKACPAGEVIGIHADIARQIKSVPDGTNVEFRMLGEPASNS